MRFTNVTDHDILKLYKIIMFKFIFMINIKNIYKIIIL